MLVPAAARGKGTEGVVEHVFNAFSRAVAKEPTGQSTIMPSVRVQQFREQGSWDSPEHKSSQTHALSDQIATLFVRSPDGSAAMLRFAALLCFPRSAAGSQSHRSDVRHKLQNMTWSADDMLPAREDSDYDPITDDANMPCKPKPLSSTAKPGRSMSKKKKKPARVSRRVGTTAKWATFHKVTTLHVPVKGNKRSRT